MDNIFDTLRLLSGKANIVHCKDLRSGLIKLICTAREVEDCPQLVAATSFGITKMTDIILSRKRLPYIDQLCEDKGNVGDSMTSLSFFTNFQTKEDLHKRVAVAIAKGIPQVTTCVKLIGDQDLTLWLRSLEDMLRELLGDDVHTYDRHIIDISQNGK
jgi:hypothetical protein